MEHNVCQKIRQIGLPSSKCPFCRPPDLLAFFGGPDNMFNGFWEDLVSTFLSFVSSDRSSYSDSVLLDEIQLFENSSISANI